MIFAQLSKHILEKSNMARNINSVETTQWNIHFTEEPTKSKLQMLQYFFKEIKKKLSMDCKSTKKSTSSSPESFRSPIAVCTVSFDRFPESGSPVYDKQEKL